MKSAIEFRRFFVHMQLPFTHSKWHNFIMCHSKSRRSKYVKPVDNGVFVVQKDIKYLQLQAQVTTVASYFFGTCFHLFSDTTYHPINVTKWHR